MNNTLSNGDWMYRNITRIDTRKDAPGYKGIVIKPYVGGGLTEASATLESNCGPIKSAWKKQGRALNVQVSIQTNTSATVYLLATSVQSVKESVNTLNEVEDIEVLEQEGNYLKVKVVSGEYQFVINGTSN